MKTCDLCGAPRNNPLDWLCESCQPLSPLVQGGARELDAAKRVRKEAWETGRDATLTALEGMAATRDEATLIDPLVERCRALTPGGGA